VRVRAEYLDLPSAVAAEADLRDLARAEIHARAGRATPAARAEDTLSPSQIARVFDIKEHWAAVGLPLMLAAALLVFAWDPKRDGRAARGAPALHLGRRGRLRVGGGAGGPLRHRGPTPALVYARDAAAEVDRLGAGRAVAGHRLEVRLRRARSLNVRSSPASGSKRWCRSGTPTTTTPVREISARRAGRRSRSPRGE
jgi:hypothetical protein